MNEKEAMQSMFDTALAHIRKQGKPSMNGYSCAYKADDGSSCAFAPFITTYHPEMEGKTSLDLLMKFPDSLNPICQDVPENFLDSIQECHDYPSDDYESGNFLSEYESHMSYLADEYELDYSPC